MDSKAFLYLFLLVVSCDKGGFFNNYLSSKDDKTCQLSSGSYEVQSATYNHDNDEYQLILYGNLGCAKNPILFSELPIAKLDDSEMISARLNYDGYLAKLEIKKDFQLKLVQKTTTDGVVNESSSMWSPMLAGAAGALGASLLARSLMKSPQHIIPPPVSKNGSDIKGVGGFGKSKNEAFSAYKRKHPRAKAPGSGKSFFKSKATVASKQQGFFRTKRKFRSKSTPSRGGFFRTKRSGRR